MRVNTTGQNVINQINQTQRSQQLNNAQLSSGNRIPNAAADVAGMAIANRMLSQFIGFNQADRNVQDGISMMQTAEGALSGIGDMTNRINELTVQAANGTLTEGQRSMIQDEINQLTREVGDTANRTEFNRQRLLDGTFSEENGGAWIQSGPNAGQGQHVAIGDMTAVAQSLEGISVVGTDGEAISQFIGTAQSALDAASAERASIGAAINRMEHQSSAIGVSAENMAASRSRIADTDMAMAAMQNVQSNILEQAQISMLRNVMQSEEMMQNMLLRTFGFQ